MTAGTVTGTVPTVVGGAVPFNVGVRGEYPDTRAEVVVVFAAG
jgi:hypothetical protein